MRLDRAGKVDWFFVASGKIHDRSSKPSLGVSALRLLIKFKVLEKNFHKPSGFAKDYFGVLLKH